MYNKFHDIFWDYYRDTFSKICMMPASDAMDSLRSPLKDSLEVEFWTNKLKYHAKIRKSGRP